MTDHPLDNPIWRSLRSRHQALAVGDARVARYPAQIAPFLGVAEDAADIEDLLPSLLPPGDTALLLARTPAVSTRWELRHITDLAQMICPEPIAVSPHDDTARIVELDASHRDDVLALTALVYPHYFRPHTMQLGRYFGIYHDGRLAAMAGERMGTDDYTELSAICTHPDFLGRGHARQLLIFLSNDNHARGRIPFLHVSHENPRAIGLYERNGYRMRRDIAFWSLRRMAE
ncbi:Acetyltransferase [Lysobacter capsici AZ78]|uniref:Acetyltransferase n=1 Tax=Lysobacter capsici AZ78 TaxID=1444315 RepID=A0A108U884_9GAMM|nr:GNAT family N-acetyltransferase [Lysobacter capsici]KWS04380.1 Acetyltransferase [Lysobacter capsici AZ78]